MGRSTALSSEALDTFLQRHLTIERVIWFLALVLFLVAWNRGLHLLYGMFAFLMAALMFSYLGAAWQLRNLKITLNLPSEGFSEKDIESHYSVTGSGQLLSFDLVDSEHCLSSQTSKVLENIVKDGTVGSSLRFARRGMHTFKQVLVSSYYPFGLLSKNRIVDVEPKQCVIYPRVSPIRQLPMEFLVGSKMDGDIPQHRTKGEEEFAMVRDYREGDEMRHIHWKMSAKHGKWVVKEFDSTKQPFMTVVLNHDKDWVIPNQFDPREHMLEVVASLAAKCAQEGYGLNVIFDDSNHCQVKPFQQDLKPLYYQLALWKGSENLQQHNLQKIIDNCPLVLTFSNSKDGPKEDLSLRSHQHQIDVQFDHNSYLGTGLKVGVRKQATGRVTRLNLSKTSTLWGLFS